MHFRYGQDQHEVLGVGSGDPSRWTYCFIGSTGSGKSTTIDLLMGLLSPSSGRLLVDGIDLHDPEYPERLLSWRAAIAHVLRASTWSTALL